MRYTSQNLAKKLQKWAAAEPKNVDEAVDRFVSFCREKNLIYLLPNVLKYLEKEIPKEEKKMTLIIRSKDDLSAETIRKIKKISNFQEKEYKVKAVEDGGILGGFIAYYQDKVFDASVNNNLSLLKNKLINE